MAKGWSALLALIALTAPLHADPDFDRGLAAFQAGSYATAIPALRAAYAADPTDEDTALLLGIAYYQTDDFERATPLLAQAERSDDDRARASARLFLGLIADRRGDADRAHAYYEQVASSTTKLGASGRVLLERDGPEVWSVVAIARPEFDSNVPLQPGTVAPGQRKGRTADVDLAIVGIATVRPVEGVPLVLDDSLSYRAESRLTDYNAAANRAGATYVLSRCMDRVALAYHFDASTLGSAWYELGHAGDLGWRHQLGHLGIGARYAIAARTFEPASYAGYSGLYQAATAEVSWGTAGEPFELGLGYVLERDHTDDRTLSAIANGGRATVRWLPGRSTDLRASLFVSDRGYDATSLGRRDLVVSGDASLYLELSESVGVVLGGSVLRNRSNVDTFDYWKWVVLAGIAVQTTR